MKTARDTSSSPICTQTHPENSRCRVGRFIQGDGVQQTNARLAINGKVGAGKTGTRRKETANIIIIIILIIVTITVMFIILKSRSNTSIDDSRSAVAHLAHGPCRRTLLEVPQEVLATGSHWL